MATCPSSSSPRILGTVRSSPCTACMRSSAFSRISVGNRPPTSTCMSAAIRRAISAAKSSACRCLRGSQTEFGGEARVRVEGPACLGRCDGAPAVLIELHRAGPRDFARVLDHLTPGDYAARLRAIIAAHLEGRDVPADRWIDRRDRGESTRRAVGPDGAAVTTSWQAYAAVTAFAKSTQAGR